MVRGYGVRRDEHGDSEEDSDGDAPAPVRSGAETSDAPLLWRGAIQAGWKTGEPPYTGDALVGRRVAAHFGDNGWYEGIVVAHEGGDYTLYFAEDDFHEDGVTLPDATTAFLSRRCEGPRVRVTQDMLP